MNIQDIAYQAGYGWKLAGLKIFLIGILYLFLAFILFLVLYSVFVFLREIRLKQLEKIETIKKEEEKRRLTVYTVAQVKAMKEAGLPLPPCVKDSEEQPIQKDTFK